MAQPRTPSWSASMLRRDLSLRAHDLARTHNLLHELSDGSAPVVIFGRDDQGRHGNFHPASYANICANPSWLHRLGKVHTASRRSRARKDWQWMELDSANSSDALLMNIFCHPEVFEGGKLAPAIANLLNIDAATHPLFGIHPGVPLRNTRATRKGRAKTVSVSTLELQFPDETPAQLIHQDPDEPEDHLTDRTEIDLQLGTLFVEAKLTESGFQTAKPRLIERYRDLDAVFEVPRLPIKLRAPSETNPRPEPLINGYQLIRNVLAAYAADAAFCVFCDVRRRDLIEIWYTILSAVHRPTFACRLKLLTWQELAATLPTDLQLFLEAKYGISS